MVDRRCFLKTPQARRRQGGVDQQGTWGGLLILGSRLNDGGGRGNLFHQLIQRGFLRCSLGFTEVSRGFRVPGTLAEQLDFPKHVTPLPPREAERGVKRCKSAIDRGGERWPQCQPRGQQYAPPGSSSLLTSIGNVVAGPDVQSIDRSVRREHARTTCRNRFGRAEARNRGRVNGGR